MEPLEDLQGQPLEYNQNAPPLQNLPQQIQGNHSLVPIASRKLNQDILSCKFDPQGQLLALGLKNGTRVLYNLDEQKFISKADDFKQNSIMSLKWKHSLDGKNKVLAAADAGGHVTFLHVPTLKPLFTLQEANNSIHSLDFSFSGKLFATGGRDFHVRIYDEQTKSVLHDFGPASWNTEGHDNRVFAVKFIDDNTLISGGWDSVVSIWDVRHFKRVSHFYGPNISGESLDYSNGMVFAGCYSAQKQLQFWDIKTLKKVEEIDWTSGNIDDAEYVYAAAINKRCPTMFGAGSTGPHSQLRIYQEKSKNPHKHTPIMKLSGLSQGCLSLDFSAKRNNFAFTTPHHGLYIYQYDKNK